MTWHYSYAAILIKIPSSKKRTGANDTSHPESVEGGSSQEEEVGEDGENDEYGEDGEDNEDGEDDEMESGDDA